MKINSDKLKAYAFSAFIGGGATAIVAFSAGWVVTTSTMEAAVNDTRVSLLSSVCLLDAKANWLAQDPVPDLTGWANREKRMEVAKRFAPILPGRTEASSEVVSECADKIETAQLA